MLEEVSLVDRRACLPSHHFGVSNNLGCVMQINEALLWETNLPAAAFATPRPYEVNGKQYVVIACGGTKLGAAGGDSYVAFVLPDKNQKEK